MIETLLDRPIAFHRIFVDITGSVAGAVMLSQAVYWSKRTKENDGWFWKTQEEWKEETGLSRFEQESTRKALKKAGILEEKLKGQPGRLFYKINYEMLEKALNDTNKIARNSQASMLETSNPVCQKLANKDARNSHTIYTENTTETTTETTTDIRNSNELPVKTKKSASKILESYLIPKELARDFIQHRKLKKAAITETVMAGIRREANKAQISINEAIRISIERNWQSFKADWIINTQQKTGGNNAGNIDWNDRNW